MSSHLFFQRVYIKCHDEQDIEQKAELADAVMEIKLNKISHIKNDREIKGLFSHQIWKHLESNIVLNFMST